MSQYQSDNNDQVNHQLDRIEAAVRVLQSDMATVRADVAVVRARVDHVERKASLWGAVGGAIAVVATHLAGCVL